VGAVRSDRPAVAAAHWGRPAGVVAIQVRPEAVRPGNSLVPAGPQP
jgi:hypothetical protein